MDYLHRVLLKNNHLHGMIKESEKKPATPIKNPDAGLEVKKNVFSSVPYVSDISEEFRRIFQHTSVQQSSKEPTPSNLSLCTLNMKFHHN